MAIHILSNISWSEDNQAMRFDQVTEYNKRNIFLQNSCKKWVCETSSNFFLLRKALYEVKEKAISSLDPWPLSEGSYELGFVHLSVLLSRGFLGIGSLVFFWNSLSPCFFVHGRARFFKKKIFAQKMGIMRRNWAKKFSH